ncbi:MAG: DNA-binding protein [Proteobacteria bacterium]|nr:DNA-binding protein [Pseudomonadota bacterium]
MSREYLSPKDTAHKIGVSVSTLQKWRSQGYGPAFIPLRGIIRYHVQDVEAWLLQQRSQSGQWGA